jgi:acyl-CoA dehydrogenase
MDFTMSPEQKDLVSIVRRYVAEEIVPLESGLDPDASELDEQTYMRLCDRVRGMGLFNLDLPEEVGGPGVDTVTRSLLAIEMSQHRAGLYSPCYGTFGPHGTMLSLTGASEFIKEKYLLPTARGEKVGCFALTEPSGGSNPGHSILTQAKKDGADYVINGSKAYISNADVADYALLFARTGEPGSGRGGVTAFVVDTDSPGFHVRRVIHTLRAGHYATELQFDDLRVPQENVVGEVGQGFTIANAALTRQRVAYSAECIGIAVKAQQLAVDYARTRSTYGKTLAEHQGITWMLIDSEHDIRTATLAVLHAADKADRGQPFRSEAATAKILATEASGRVIDRAIQIHGGMGVTKDLPLERWYREVRIRRIGEGPTEVQRLIVGRELLNGPYRFFIE